MKKIIKMFIGFFAMIMLILVIVMVHLITKKNTINEIITYEKPVLINEQSVDYNDITDISIEASSIDIYVLSSDSEEEVLIKEYSNKKDAESFADVSSNNNQINISAKKNKQTNFFNISSYNEYEYVEVYLPKDYQGDLNTDTQSGDSVFDINSIINNIDVNSSSGDVIINKLEANGISITSSSGDVIIDTTIENVQNTYIKTSSGDTTIKSIVGYLNINSQSGDISISQLNGYSTIKSASGDIIMNVEEVIGDIEITSSSGEVICQIDDKNQYYLNATSTYGEIAIKQSSYTKSIKTTIGSNPENTINITVASGDITVN